MAKKVIMPKFGMDQEEGTVVRWIKAEGDTVRRGEPLLEVETDKVNMDVESPADGILAAISAEPGRTVPIGETIALILAPGESLAAPTQAPSAPAAAPQRVTAPLPEPVRATPVAANVARSHGVALNAVAPAAPGQRITRRDVEDYLAAQHVPDAAPAGPPSAVPAARRLAREAGVDLAAVQGTGPQGRIQSHDVTNVISQTATIDSGALEEEVPASEPARASGRVQRRFVPLSSVRRTIARRMVASSRETPQFTVEMQAHMGRALELLDQLAAAKNQTVRITLTALLVRVCAAALHDYPQINASFQGHGIAEWADANIGVAVAAEEGLVVPVIQQAQTLSLAQIAARLEELAGRARAGRLTPADVQDGTFTISNLGMFGAERFTAIINPPQAAILAVGRVVKTPWVNEAGEMVVAPLMSLTLSADHRIVDGALAARFLAAIKAYLELPALLL